MRLQQDLNINTRKGSFMLPFLTKVFIVSILIFFYMFSPNFVSAEDKETLPFSVSLEIPNNQLDNVKNYFHLKMKPNTKQTVNLLLTNVTNENVTLTMKSSNALSTETGIVYIPEREANHSKLIDDTYYLDKNIETPENVNLKPYETKKVPVTISVPNIEEGSVLGGVTVGYQYNEAKELKDASEKDVSFQVKNKINFNIGILLNISNLKEITPITFGQVTTEMTPQRAIIYTNVTNSNGEIQRDFSFSYKVIDEKDKVVFEGKTEKINLAPKSNFMFPITWTGETLKAGNYYLVINDDIVAPFTIDRSDVKDFAAKSGIDLPNPLLNMSPVAWIIVSLLVVGLAFLAFLFGKRKNKEENTVDVT